MKETEKTTVFRFRLTSDLKERFERITDKKAINRSELLRQLIQKWLEENEK